MKKFLSTILAVVMVLSSMATVAFAADSDYADGYFYVKGVYDTPYTEIGDAVSAAGTNGTVIVSGTIAFNSRRAVSTDITLEGVNNATIVPTTSFGSPESTTNWKALLNLNGDITVKNITFDGSEYGDDISASTDFVPLRCAEGTITLENVTITGSPRTLMIVGSSSTTANVTASNLVCYAEYKDLPIASSLLGSTIYSDIDVAKGSFTLNSGEVNGFIGTSGGTFTNGTENHYTLTDKVLWIEKSTTTTLKHYVESYDNAIENGNSYAEHFVDSITDSGNLAVVGEMVEEAENMVATDRVTVELFVALLEDAYEASNNAKIQEHINTLNAALNPSTGA